MGAGRFRTGVSRLRPALPAVVIASLLALLPFPTCLFRLVLGIPCPACGLTRATLAAARLDAGAAIAFHPLALPLIGAAAVTGVLAFVAGDAMWKKWVPAVCGAAGVALMVVWALRLVGLLGGPVPAGADPAPATAAQSVSPAPPVPSGDAPKPPAVRPPSAAELALVAPLVPGSELDGFTVLRVRGVEQGRMRVVVGRADGEVRLDVALADPEATSVPPATAGRYAVFYSLRGATAEEGERLAKKLGEVIAKNAAAATPEGMGVYRPGPRPGTTL